MTASEAYAALEGLQQLPQPDLIQLWEILDAPEPGELLGEYTGHLMLRGLSVEQRTWAEAWMLDESSGLGYWLGKAFDGRASGTGEGYNFWRKSEGNTERNLRFGTEFRASERDGRPALCVTYASFNNGAGKDGLVDHIRKAGPGLYLGLALRPDGDGLGLIPGAGCFVLTGPVGLWVGVDDPRAEAIA
jgi:hypothetical protein